LKLLGKGAFGRVYLVRRRKTQDVYALKAIKIDKNWG
jgi:serine/threonine protein kinase